MNYPIKYEDLKDSEFFKETIFRRLYYYFNWPLGDSYIEDFKQIESFYKSKGYNFELIEQRHPVIKYNEKYYYLNVLTDLETQFKQIVNDEILGYDDPKRYYYEAFVEHFERLGDWMDYYFIWAFFLTEFALILSIVNLKLNELHFDFVKLGMIFVLTTINSLMFPVIQSSL